MTQVDLRCLYSILPRHILAVGDHHIIEDKETKKMLFAIPSSGEEVATSIEIFMLN